MSDSPAVAGLVLAAGAGTRFGGPKALARTADGTPWVALAVSSLADAGCREVVVALGAGADDARALVPARADVVVIDHWAEGLSATLRAALPEAARRADAVVVVPVDTPEMPSEVVRRIVAAAGAAGAALRGALVQAVYHGVPGHPALLGSGHIDDLTRTLSGDRGARAYLVAHGVTDVECADMWSGADHDVP
ncbi:NTP transferase domain-containing protein [Microbacterium sp. BK668]|uniref:nucleotidyltransferase family protein n=1 Tax=Microbacterium sp. BK668 TaxID=2512118 RepID=UPI001061C28F|nr:NTP transferase domain-containing protein [Microbacterium sp. BK668]TDN90959.1 molybdenum cofactor cytidylyltransferase [Microbacterium sp. BK668]